MFFVLFLLLELGAVSATQAVSALWWKPQAMSPTHLSLSRSWWWRRGREDYQFAIYHPHSASDLHLRTQSRTKPRQEAMSRGKERPWRMTQIPETWVWRLTEAKQGSGEWSWVCVDLISLFSVNNKMWRQLGGNIASFRSDMGREYSEKYIRCDKI